MAVPRNEEDVPPLPAGYRIAGKFAVRRLIARGGCAQVYEAEHAAIGRPVAIKVVHSAAGVEDGVLERLRREARICGSLRHPHVCEVYDVGHLEGGAAYLVMELLAGPTLADLLDEGPLSIAAAVEVARSVASALVAAHREGVIHRDVKPHNVILAEAGDGAVLVKLLDFGIARPLVFADTDRSVTIEGMLVGTPHYMAPEQLQAEPPTERSDVYSLGVMLYESVTGRVPFDEPTLAALSAAVLRDPIVPPRRLRFDCSASLEALILRSVTRDPSQRIASAAAFLEALEHLAAAESLPTGASAFRAPRRLHVVPEPEPEARLDPEGAAAPVKAADSLAPPAPRTLPPPADRSRARWPAAAIALLVASSVAAWIWQGADRTPPGAAARPASAGASSPSDERALAAAPGAQARVVAPSSVDEAQAADAALVEPATLEEARALRPTKRRRPDRTNRQAAEALRPAVVPASAAPEPAPPEVAPPEPAAPGAAEGGAAPPPSASAQELTRQALAAYARGQLPRARTLYRRATESSPGYAPAWRGLGLVAARMGQRGEATSALRRYLELAPDAPDADRMRATLRGL